VIDSLVRADQTLGWLGSQLQALAATFESPLIRLLAVTGPPKPLPTNEHRGHVGAGTSGHPVERQCQRRSPESASGPDVRPQPQHRYRAPDLVEAAQDRQVSGPHGAGIESPRRVRRLHFLGKVGVMAGTTSRRRPPELWSAISCCLSAAHRAASARTAGSRIAGVDTSMSATTQCLPTVLWLLMGFLRGRARNW